MSDNNIPESPDSSAKASIAKLTEQWRLADIQAWNAEAERNDAVAKHAALVEALRDLAASWSNGASLARCLGPPGDDAVAALGGQLDECADRLSSLLVEQGGDA